MIIKDIRKDFFDLLQHERILLVANLDVDSVCAVKILETLLQCDGVLYTLVPVVGKSDLVRAFDVRMILEIFERWPISAKYIHTVMSYKKHGKSHH